MSIKATKDNAKFVSKVYTQEASDTDWAKAKPKVKFKYKEVNVLDNSTTSELVIEKSISEGDIIVVNDNEIKKKILKDSDILQNKNLVDNPDPFGDGSGVALWQLDGDAKDTGGRYDGRWEGNEQYGVGRFGQAAKFDGSSGNSIKIPKEARNGLSKFTISLWFRNDKNDDSNTINSIYQESITTNNPYNGIQIWQGYNSNKLYVRTQFNNGANLADLPVDGKFHHVVVVSSGNGRYKCFYDCDYILTINDDDSISDIQYITLGSNFFDKNSQNMIGAIDQVRIFNRPLTEEEIQKLYTEEVSKFNISDLNLSQAPQKIWIIDGSIITTKGGSTTTKLVLPPNNVKLFDTLIVNDGAEKEIIVRSVEKDANGNDVVQIGQELALVPSEVVKVNVPEVIIDIEPTEQELSVLEKGERVKLTPLQISYDKRNDIFIKEAQEFERTGRALQYAIKSPKDIEISQLNIDLWKKQ